MSSFATKVHLHCSLMPYISNHLRSSLIAQFNQFFGLAKFEDVAAVAWNFDDV